MDARRLGGGVAAQDRAAGDEDLGAHHQIDAVGLVGLGRVVDEQVRERDLLGAGDGDGGHRRSGRRAAARCAGNGGRCPPRA